MVVITFGGLAGAGKSTVAKIVAQRLGLRYISVGHFFRQLAEEAGMNIKDFMKTVDEEVHRKVDHMTEEESKRGNVIIDGRMAAFFAKNAFKVFITADDDERARRISQREGIPLQVAKKYVLERDRTDRENYLRIYGYDMLDIKAYNLVIDTTRLTPEDAAELVISAVERWRW